MNLNKGFLLFIFLVFYSTISLFAQSVEFTWDGGGAAGVWEDANNWNPNGVPSVGDDILIDGAYAVTVSSTSTIKSIQLKGGADLTISATYSLTVSSSGANHDGIDILDPGSILTVNGTLSSSGHLKSGIDLGVGCNLTIGSTGTVSISNVTANGIQTEDNIENDGTITITNHGKDGIRLEGNVANRTALNDGTITISGGEYGINQSLQNWLFTNNGTVTLSNASMALVRDGTDFVNNGTFKGNGLIENGSNYDFNTPPGSTLAPGTSIGKLSFSNKADFTSNTINIEIDGDGTPGVDYDQIVVNSGSVKITDATLNLSGSYIPTGGEVFLFLEKVGSGNINGTFAGLPEGATVPFNGSAFIISYQGGVGGNDITLTFDSPLPVELIDFSAQAIENEVKLAWSTATETNNDYFTLERSSDGRSFESIAIVLGNGNTTEISKYNYLDKNPGRGLNYYRLKQTDYDGQYSYSDIQSVKFGTDETVKVYPTIVESELVVETGGDLKNELTVIIRDLTGKEHKAFVIPSKSNRLSFSIDDLTPGAYFVVIYNNESVQTQKIIKL